MHGSSLPQLSWQSRLCLTWLRQLSISRTSVPSPFQSGDFLASKLANMDLQMDGEPPDQLRQHEPEILPAGLMALPIRVPALQEKLLPISETSSNRTESSDVADGKFSTSLVHRYSASRLGSRQWACQICNRRAVDLIHVTVSSLYIHKSTIFDTLIPVCTYQDCVTRGYQLAKSLNTNKQPETPATTDCENCGNLSRLKLCGACRFTHKRMSFSCVACCIFG